MCYLNRPLLLIDQGEHSRMLPKGLELLSGLDDIMAEGCFNSDKIWQPLVTHVRASA